MSKEAHTSNTIKKMKVKKIHFIWNNLGLESRQSSGMVTLKAWGHLTLVDLDL
jgi:hypothetical protein